MRVVVSNTPQARDDAFSQVLGGDAALLDVLANDRGGDALQLWSLGAGSVPDDPLASNLTGVTTLGASTSIVNGQVL